MRAEPSTPSPSPLLPAQPLFPAAVLAAALGALLFVGEQGHVLALDRERLSPLLVAVYAVLFGALGLAGAALLRLPVGARPASGPPRLLALAAAGYYLLVLITFFVRRGAGEPVRGVGALLLAALPFALVVAPLARLGPRLEPWIRATGAAALALGWAFSAPERSAFGSAGQTPPLAWLAHALFLAAVLALLLAARRGLPLPRWTEAAALALLLAAALAVHAVAGRRIFQAERPGQSSPEPAGDAAAASGPRRPNVVLVVWDSVRRDHLSVYGYPRPTTPFLEELAGRSVVYTRAVAPAPWTLPSHASLLTGLYPRSHGAHSFWRRDLDERGFYYRGLAAGPLTLAERLRAVGYRTGAVSANFYFAGRRAGLGRGFDFFSDDRNALYLDPIAGFRLAGRLLAALETRLPMGLAARLLTPYVSAREVSDRALAFVDAPGGGDRARPFFLFLNYMEAHEPYNPAPRYRHLYPGFRRELAFAQVRDVWLRALAGRRPIPEAERAHLVSQYDAALLTLDEEARRLTAELDRRGLLADTLLVFTSDHGELLGEHGMTGHGQDVYEELLGIPLIVKLPGERRRGRDGTRVESRDLYRWVLAEAGLTPGRSRSPGLAGAAPSRRPWDAAAERYPAAPNPLPDGTPLARLTRGRRAFYFGPYKLIASSDGEEELYDLARDPREGTNLIHRLPAIADRGRALVRRFLTSVPAAPEPTGPGGADGGGGAEEIERLRALGYAAAH